MKKKSSGIILRSLITINRLGDDGAVSGVRGNVKSCFVGGKGFRAWKSWPRTQQSITNIVFDLKELIIYYRKQTCKLTGKVECDRCYDQPGMCQLESLQCLS